MLFQTGKIVVQQIKRYTAILGFLMMLAAPVASYYTTIGEIRADYVKKSEMEKVQDKLNRIAEDVAEIKGYLRPRK